MALVPGALVQIIGLRTKAQPAEAVAGTNATLAIFQNHELENRVVGDSGRLRTPILSRWMVDPKPFAKQDHH
eukprot:1154636-Amphidinium_carterae.2